MADLTFLLAAAWFSTGFGDPVYFSNKRGNQLYSEDRYEEALKEYRKAQVSDPESKPTDFNLGDTLYKLGKYKEATRAYTRVMSSDNEELGAMAAFNRGAALYKSGDKALNLGDLDKADKFFRESARQYKELLKKNPSDVDSKHNLELALEKLRETEKKKKQQEKQKQEKQESKPEKGDGEQKQKDARNNDNGADEKQDNESAENGKEKEQKENKETKKNDDEKKSAGKPHRISPEEAQSIFRAIEQDERSLREKLRAKEMGEARKSGKDW